MIFWSRGWGWRLTTEMQETNVDPGRQGLCVVAAMDKFTQTKEGLWRRRDIWPLSKRERGRERVQERERADPCLDRLLLLFWAHYIEDGLHLLCTSLFWVVTFYRKPRRGCCLLHQRRRIFANVKGKVVQLVTLHTWEV